MAQVIRFVNPESYRSGKKYVKFGRTVEENKFAIKLTE